MAQKRKIVLLTRSLEAGGAEVQLVSLATALPRNRYDVTVLCFYEIGPLLEDLKEAGIPVISLQKSGRWDIFPFFARLVRILRQLRPDIVHAFLGPPNILAALSKFFLPTTRIVWGIRASNMDLTHYDFTWRIGFAMERRLSGQADLIVVNSAAGRDHARRKQFRDRHLVVVPNGIDTDRLNVDPSSRAEVRAGWGVADGDCLIGIIARLDPMKDHETFLRAAALFVKEQPNARFVCIGGDGMVSREGLCRLAAELEIGSRIIWAGYRGDMAEVMSALDIHTSASAFGEGFPNAVAESMATGLPNAVTDVGDAAQIVGGLGEVVPPRDPVRLAAAWRALAALDPAASSRRRADCKARINDNFSRALMIERMDNLYGELVRRSRP